MEQGSLLKQLAIANKSIGGGVVVVLAERDKEEMEMDIGKLGFDFMGTSVICRSGSPLILADLKKVLSYSSDLPLSIHSSDGFFSCYVLCKYLLYFRPEMSFPPHRFLFPKHVLLLF